MLRVVVHNYLPVGHWRAIDSRDEFARVYQEAARIDPMRYLKGLTKVRLVKDDDKWNADYGFDDDIITIRDKFHKKPFRDRVQILLHEAGHRGQALDPTAFEAFKREGLVTEPHFLAMANEVHQDDFKANGIEPDIMADECFAESYSRYALGWELPEPIKSFWTRRINR